MNHRNRGLNRWNKEYITFLYYLEHLRLQILRRKLIVTQVQFRKVNYLFKSSMIDFRDFVPLQDQSTDFYLWERFHMNQQIPFERRNFYSFVWPLYVFEVVS